MEKLELSNVIEYANNLFNKLEMLHTEHDQSYNVYKKLKLYDNRFSMDDGNVHINNEYRCESIDCASKFLTCLGCFLQPSNKGKYHYADSNFSNVWVDGHFKEVNDDGTVDIIVYVDIYYENNNDAKKEATDNNDEYVNKITISNSKGHALHFKIKGGKIKWRN